ncbi:hypothetical protein E7Y32_05205 [Arthrobacter sp. UKPF54-2]|uniref:hypothetical protein n=1 Tax=Arthrobacter sp. UKPF54-2 TaxID=2600159 RepID=UPI0011B16F4D|nr:hypothetical protein [Arthrobacter sp. UKPF54-2]QDY89683.1 hypothetical protein E7Y32_05205 [Arthrobacter sp. UKPF54-2]
MSRRRVVVVALLGLALAGCQPNAGAPSAGAPGAETSSAGPSMTAAAVATPSSAEFAAIIQTAVEDRNGVVLDLPPAPRLPEGKTTAAYRAKRERDLPVVTEAKTRFKSFGFWYTSFSTTVTVESTESSGAEATVRFKELTEQYQASAANGPNNVPEEYSLPQIATFKASAQGWQLDSITPVGNNFGLPMTVVAH